MVIFGPKPWVNTLEKKSIFRLFKLLVFIAQEGVFLCGEYRKRLFPGLYCIKNKLQKGPFFIIRVFELRVFVAQKGVFLFQSIVKDIFVAYILSKKKVGKMAIFQPKPWVNPFGKMSIFRLFELLVFIAQKGVFSFQNIIKDIFLTYIA